MALYPWHDIVWQQLYGMQRRMPHALLLQGRQGIGKRVLAETLAQYLLCEERAVCDTPCGTCQSCHWFLQDNHPDYRRIESEETVASEDVSTEPRAGKKRQISVDQIRELADFLGLSSHRAGLRIVMIHPAEALNQSSANALLKMLEEPPPDFLFLLVAHQPHQLLPTIRSRCSKIEIPLPTRIAAETWLQDQGVPDAAARLAYTGGAPLQALALDNAMQNRLRALLALLHQAEGMDPFAAAAILVKEGLPAALEILGKWVHDLLSATLAGEVRFHQPERQALQSLANKVDLGKLLDYQRLLNEMRRHAQHPLNVDMQLEGLMIQYTHIFDTVQS